MKALIAMSGGVDSSVAAKLTMEDGYECIGCTMKLFERKPGEEDEDLPAMPASAPADAAGNEGPKTATVPETPKAVQTCGSPDDAADARKVADRLGMPFYVFDFQEDFRRCVMDPFVDAYSHGRTPNPCIYCNRHLKFGRLLDRARQLGCDCVVTGHYARIEKDPDTGRFLLKKGLDETKDQSYVLYNMTQELLAHVRMPLGVLTKTRVRELAEADGFVNADKPDSQDICFVPDGDYAGMICRYSGRDFPPGEFVDLDGGHMGTHKGIIHYTIGQTRRLGQAFGRPRYVCRIDAETNRIYLGGPDDVYSTYAKAGDFNWISGEIPEGDVRCKVRTRYKQKEQWATVRPVRAKEGAGNPAAPADAAPEFPDSEPGIMPADVAPGNGSPASGFMPAASGLMVEIFFDEPQRAITPGQAAVLYDGDTVLGGGTLL